jgi:hypothetical protein
MRIRYIGAEASTETFGKTFYQWKWVGIADMDEGARAILEQNPQFETEAAIDGHAEPTSPSGKVEDAESVPGGEV